MRKNWHETAWDDYVAAQSQDRKRNKHFSQPAVNKCHANPCALSIPS